MLTSLHIKNFALIEELTLEFEKGMTVLTGETGAGKSILIDALGIALGNRADITLIRGNESRSEISALFSGKFSNEVINWLTENDITQEDEQLLFRRTLQREGRSNCFINGHPVTSNQLKQLGTLLISIHGQHEQQQLLNRDFQRDLLDAFAEHPMLVKQIKELYRQWKNLHEELVSLQQPTTTSETRLQFLYYQLQELQELNLQLNEWDLLHTEQKQLSQAENIIYHCRQTLITLSENDQMTLCDQLHQLRQSLLPFAANNTSLTTVAHLLENAGIELNEAAIEIKNFLSAFNTDPERLLNIEHRLSIIHELARKHQCKPEQLTERLHHIENEISQLENSEKREEEIKIQLKEIEMRYQTTAAKLTKSRTAAAKKLSTLITRYLPQLGMPKAEFLIELILQTENQPTLCGNETIQFAIKTNPGQAPQALNKIVSGGELSRIALAIDVITAHCQATPTIIFDEIDSGVGGAIAAQIGQLLRKLGNSSQVLCVTHLPQVASYANAHYRVSKLQSKRTTNIEVKNLISQERIEEVARMLGGVKITDQTRAHAEEMLQMVE